MVVSSSLTVFLMLVVSERFWFIPFGLYSRKDSSIIHNCWTIIWSLQIKESFEEWFYLIAISRRSSLDLVNIHVFQCLYDHGESRIYLVYYMYIWSRVHAPPPSYDGPFEGRKRRVQPMATCFWIHSLSSWAVWNMQWFISTAIYLNAMLRILGRSWNLTNVFSRSWNHHPGQHRTERLKWWWYSRYR